MVYAAKGGHRFLNNGTTCDVAFRQNPLTICSITNISNNIHISVQLGRN